MVIKTKKQKREMYFCFIVIFLSIIVLIILFFNKGGYELQTYEDVELEKYMGTWYSLYELPSFFSKNCINTKAQYELVDEKVLVYNSCIRNNKEVVISGYGVKKYDNDNSKLKINFGFFRKGDYYIIYVDKEYENAIVGTPDRKYLWFLSRNKEIDNNKLDEMLNIAKQNDFNINKLIEVKHIEIKNG